MNIFNMFGAQGNKMQQMMQQLQQDLEIIDKATHALKSISTYAAMKGNSEYSYEGNDGSYARARSRTTGRYMSRDYDPREEYRRY